MPRCPLEIPLHKRLREMVQMGDLGASDAAELLDWVFQQTGTCEIRCSENPPPPDAQSVDTPGT